MSKYKFFSENNSEFIENNFFWKILIVDDIEEIFTVTKNAFRNKEIFNKKIEFYYASSAEEAKEILKTVKDIAVAIVDVVMENRDSGLKLIDFIREEIKNKLIQLIIRTGYPGENPELVIFNEYNINDYIEKGSNTNQRLYITIRKAIQTYDLLKNIDEKVMERTLELNKKNRQLNAFMDNTPNFSYIKDSEGKYEIACKTMTDMFGLKNRDDIIGKTDKELFSELVKNGEIAQKQADRMLASIQEDNDFIFRDGNDKLTKDYPRITRYKGKIKEIHITATKVKLYCDRENKECIVGIGKDISEIQTFIFNIFHTLRSTSNKLNQTIESALTIFKIKDIDEYFKLPNDGTNISINRYAFYKTLLLFRNRIHKLKFFLSTGALDIKELKDPKETSIKEILDYIIDIEHYELDLKRPNIKILYNDNFIDYILDGDIDKLDLCFYNIIDNAIKFSLKVNGEYKNIEISSEYFESVYHLYITNYGKTIKKEEIHEIFNQFKRGSVSEDYNIKGSGFGLYICKKILHLHNASIDMKVDEFQKKTTIIVKFKKPKQIKCAK